MKAFIFLILLIPSASYAALSVEADAENFCEILNHNLSTIAEEDGIQKYYDATKNSLFEFNKDEDKKYPEIVNSLNLLIESYFQDTMKPSGNLKKILNEKCQEEVGKAIKLENEDKGLGDISKKSSNYDFKKHKNEDQIINGNECAGAEKSGEVKYDNCGKEIVDNSIKDLSSYFSQDLIGIRNTEQLLNVKKNVLGDFKCDSCFEGDFYLYQKGLKESGFDGKKLNFVDEREKKRNEIKEHLTKEKVKTSFAILSKSIELSEDLGIWISGSNIGESEKIFNNYANSCQGGKFDDNKLLNLYANTPCGKQAKSISNLKKEIDNKIKKYILPALGKSNNTNADLTQVISEFSQDVQKRKFKECPNQSEMDRSVFKKKLFLAKSDSYDIFDSLLQVTIEDMGRDQFLKTIKEDGQRPRVLVETMIKNPVARNKFFKQIACDATENKRLREKIEQSISQSLKDYKCSEMEYVNSISKLFEEKIGKDGLDEFFNESLASDSRLELLMQDDLSFKNFLDLHNDLQGWNSKGFSKIVRDTANYQPENFSKIFTQRRDRYCEDFYNNLSKSLCYTDEDFENDSYADKSKAAEELAKQSLNQGTNTYLNAMNNIAFSSFLCKTLDSQDGMTGLPSIYEDMYTYFGGVNLEFQFGSFDYEMAKIKTSQEIPDYVGKFKNDLGIDTFGQFHKKLACEEIPNEILSIERKFAQMVELNKNQDQYNQENNYIPPTGSNFNIVNQGSGSSGNNDSSNENDGGSSGPGFGNNNLTSNNNSGVNPNSDEPQENKTKFEDQYNKTQGDDGVIEQSGTTSFGYNYNNFNYQDNFVAPVTQDKEELVGDIKKIASSHNNALNANDEKVLNDLNENELSDLKNQLQNTNNNQNELKKLESELAKLKDEKKSLEFEKRELEYKNKIAELEKNLSDKNKNVKREISGDIQKDEDIGSKAQDLFGNTKPVPTNNETKGKSSSVTGSTASNGAGNPISNSGAEVPFRNNNGGVTTGASGSNGNGVILTSDNVSKYFNNKENQTKDNKNKILKEFVEQYPNDLAKHIIEENGKIRVKIPTAKGIIYIEQNEIDSRILKKILVAKNNNQEQVKLSTAQFQLTKLQDQNQEFNRKFSLLDLKIKLFKTQK
jgi:hypothetical protein